VSPPSTPRTLPVLPPSPASSSSAGPATRLGRWRTRLSTAYHLIRANPTGRITLKIIVGVVGAAVVALGLILVPLPGPGWLIVILGLSILAIEFAWARHLLHFTRTQVQRWTGWIARQSWPVRIVVGLISLIFVSVVVWQSLRISFDIDVVERIWDYFATR
jgi:uncharacterized protein (TIGR02611 family)